MTRKRTLFGTSAGDGGKPPGDGNGGHDDGGLAGDDAGLTRDISRCGTNSMPARPDTPALEMELMKGRVKAELFQKPQKAVRISRFLLIERIATGGMGEIYAAYDEKLDRKVAIKLVRSDVDERDNNASVRLWREAQTLARLSHPNVVQVYEVGMFRARVFLAMEFIRGTTLRAWVKAQREVPERIRWRAILAKFLDAGRGLDAAHAAGLVHRDFKPENVLVGNNDRVYVVDFGLAHAHAGHDQSRYDPSSGDLMKTIDGRDGGLKLQPATRLTVSGDLLGTPAYMPPEQLDGRATDVRSDQFSFCVALYEALYGTRPFAADNFESLKAMIKSGSVTVPPRTSPVPQRIWKALARGLSVKPHDRYPSMQQLLDELSWNATRRRRWVGAALLCAALVVGGGFTLQAAVSETDPCAAAASGTDPLWNQARRAQVRESFDATGISYADDLFSRVDQRVTAYVADLGKESRDSCVATHVRREQSPAVFALRTRCIDERRRQLDALLTGFAAAQPALVEHSVHALASLPALASCHSGEALAFGVHPPDDPITARQTQAVLDRLAQARVIALSDRSHEAMRLAETELDATGSLDYPPLRARALYVASLLWAQSGEAEAIGRAERAMLEAVDLAESHRDDELAADIWNSLVWLATQHHTDLSLGHSWARRALATSARAHDSGRRRAESLYQLGRLHAREGNLAEAEGHQRKGVELAAASAVPAVRLADYWRGLAMTLHARSRLDDARDGYEEALALYRAELGAGHAMVAQLEHHLGILLHQTGELRRARQLFESARLAWTQRHGATHPDVGRAHVSLAGVDGEIGDLSRAEAEAGKARAIYAQALDPHDPRQADPELTLGTIYLRGRRFDDSLAAYRRALTMARPKLSTARANPAGPSGADSFDPRVFMIQVRIGEVEVQLGRVDEAMATLARAEQALPDTMPAPAGRDPEASAQFAKARAFLLKSRGLAFLARADIERARAALERALALYLSLPGYPLDRADVQWALARALRRGGAWPDERARSLAAGALSLYIRYGKSGQLEHSAIKSWLAKSPPDQQGR
ncbi:MAG: serine/threonine-protein kinase [Proteobacteria bacterium]|nr:serine/threonine-protein kinase [Pseudomonadota bacterium]